MKILYINACVRNNSRTNLLARHLLGKLSGNITEVRLELENIKPLNLELLTKRENLIIESNYDDEIFKYAKQFKEADIIVISSPYYDLSFSSLLKIYLENVCSLGLTFRYDKDGNPVSLCNCKKLYYITTAGGYILDDSFGFGYIKELSKMFFGIRNIEYIKAEGLDIIGNDYSEILNNKIKEIDNLF